jgi:hypothetical protein
MFSESILVEDYSLVSQLLLGTPDISGLAVPMATAWGVTLSDETLLEGCSKS